MEKKKERELNFELLRVISMFIIVVFHYNDWGGIINIESPIKNKIFGEFIAIGGNLGVNLFILISGYFLVKSKFKLKKILKIIFEVWFYSVAMFVVCYVFKLSPVGKAELKQALLPITYNMYWFATTYIGMYFVFPILNKLISNINQNQYKTVLVLLGIMLSVIPTLVLGTRPFGGELAWFIYLYLIAAYIRKYNTTFKSNKYLILTGVAILIFMMGYQIGCTLRGQSMATIVHLNQKSSLFTLALSIVIFMLFKNIKVGENKVIPFFSKATFGVYLIHINAHFRGALFYDILKMKEHYNSELIALVGYVLGTALIIYIVSTLIDTLRRKLIEEPLFKIKVLDKYFEKIDKLMDLENDYIIHDKKIKLLGSSD